jgi:hypothetical protein
MAKTFVAGDDAAAKIADALEEPFRQSRKFLTRLGTVMDRDTSLVFRNEGNYSGHDKWKFFSINTLVTKRGTWKIRYGTDRKGRAKGTYKPGVLRPGIRRYSPQSKLLQASGGFRKSFGVQRILNQRLIYGTNMEIAKDIMSDPVRNVLEVTKQDEQRYFNMWSKFYAETLPI